MTQIFNTSFELSMRALIQISLSKGLNVDLITSYDMFTTYGKRYGMLDYDLNGKNTFNLSELNARRKIISEALKELVLENLISVVGTNKGFIYFSTKKGDEVISKMTSDYANEYISMAKIVKSIIANKTEPEIMRMVSKPIIGGNY